MVGDTGVTRPPMIPNTTDQGDDDAHDPQTNIFDTIMVTSLGKSVLL